MTTHESFCIAPYLSNGFICHWTVSEIKINFRKGENFISV